MIDMDAITLNMVALNSTMLNAVIAKKKKTAPEAGESDVPSGYEEFMAADGPFSAKDGEFYVKR